MRYIDHDLSFIPKFSDDTKQHFNLVITQGCRRLIEANDLQVFPAAGLHDFNHLLIRNAQVLNLGRRPDRKSEVMNDLLCHLIGLRLVNNPPSVGRHPPKVDIFRYTQLQKNLPFLIDYADSCHQSFVWCAEVLFLAIKQVLSFVRLIVPI